MRKATFHQFPTPCEKWLSPWLDFQQYEKNDQLSTIWENDLPTPAPNNMGKLIFPHKLATARAWLQTIWETCPSNPNNMRNRTFHRFHIILEPVESTFAFNQFRTNLDSVWFLIILKSDRSHFLIILESDGDHFLSRTKHFMQYYWIRISESYNFWNQMGVTFHKFNMGSKSLSHNFGLGVNKSLSLDSGISWKFLSS
jgi:hypothetical protein